MPLPLIAGQIAAVGLGALSQGVSDTFQNNRQLGYYNLQKQDAWDMWRANNKYNSPVEQVKRLQEAKISPHSQGGIASIVGNSKSNEPQRPQLNNNIGSYQVNGAINAANMMQAVEQIKQIKAQTANIEQDTQSKKLTYDVDAETLRSKRFAEIWQMAASLENTKMDTASKEQTITNMKGQLESVLQDVELKKVERVYQSDYLRGRNDLQKIQQSHTQSQINEIRSRIANLNANTNSTNTRLPFEVREITRRIDSLRLSNESKNVENVYQPDYLRERNNKAESDAKLSKEQLDYLQTLPPEFRYIIDKAPHLLESLMNMRGKNIFKQGFRTDKNGNESSYQEHTKVVPRY